MATIQSLEYANTVAVPQIKNLTNVRGGKLRHLWFSFATATATPIANGDTMQLGTLTAGNRIAAGFVSFGAMGASATMSIGYSGATTRYASSIDVSALGTTSFANTAALNFGDILAADQLLLLTAGGANYAASKAILGFITYEKD